MSNLKHHSIKSLPIEDGWAAEQPSQFYSVYDCFGTTCDKVSLLERLLASVHTDLYSSDPYLYYSRPHTCVCFYKFDKSILDSIEDLRGALYYALLPLTKFRREGGAGGTLASARISILIKSIYH